MLFHGSFECIEQRQVADNLASFLVQQSMKVSIIEPTRWEL